MKNIGLQAFTPGKKNDWLFTEWSALYISGENERYPKLSVHVAPRSCLPVQAVRSERIT